MRRRLRVASSPTRATTISPELAVSALLDDDDVAVEDAGVDHGVALHLQDEVLARAQQGLGHLKAVALLLDRLDGRAGGDAAEDRQLADVVGVGRGRVAASTSGGPRLPGPGA